MAIIYSDFGKRVKFLRNMLNLNQEELAELLGISQNYISQIETGTRTASEQLIKSLCYCFYLSESWLRTGEGEIYTPPLEAIKNLMSRYNQQDIIDAFGNMMKERGLAMAMGRNNSRTDSGDPELDRIINILYSLWATGDERLKTWAAMQFDFAISKHLDEEILKKQKEPAG